MLGLLPFGTDGIRDVADRSQLCRTAFLLAQALARKSLNRADSAKILIARDTRTSGSVLEQATASGAASYGATAIVVGVLPTPACAALTVKYGCDYGIMISASHNTAEYNGVKVFTASGRKLSSKEEAALFASLTSPEPPRAFGKIVNEKNAAFDYVKCLAALLPNLTDLRIVLDLANGATNATAPLLFSGSGARCRYIGTNTDGAVVNLDCGSTYPESIINAVRAFRADVGFAFDGDGDRILVCDRKGTYSGDRLLYLFANRLKKAGKLTNDTVAGTLLTNMGLETALAKKGIRLIRTDVGDKFLSETMTAKGLLLGGEESGHLIFREYAETGDGLLAATLFLRVMTESGKLPHELLTDYEEVPTVSRNFPLPNDKKQILLDDEEVTALLAEWQERLGKEGRMLLRASGTEPKLRVTVECESEALCRMAADSMLGLLAKRLSALSID